MTNKTSFFALIVIGVFFLTNVKGQTNNDISRFNSIKAIHLPPLEYVVSNEQSTGTTLMYDIYGAREIIKSILKSKGFKLIESKEVLNDSERNDCSIAYCNVYHTSEINPQIIDGIVVVFTDCNYQPFYATSAKVLPLVAEKVTTKIPVGRIPVQNATREALKELEGFDYALSIEDEISKIIIPESNLTYKQIKDYCRKECTNSLEGLYNSVSVDFYSLKLFIRKDSDFYELIIAESNNPEWSNFQIRGNVQKQDNIYTGKFLFHNYQEVDIKIDNSGKEKIKIVFYNQNSDSFEIELKKKY